MELNDLPDMLTVEEAAQVLRISRTASYEAAGRWERTHGRDGIPALRIGRTLRVPKAALQSWIDQRLRGDDARRTPIVHEPDRRQSGRPQPTSSQPLGQRF